jgi:hypothetical protein
MHNPNLDSRGRSPELWDKLGSKCAWAAISLMVAVGFLLRALPLLQYPRVGGDPFLHYKYSMALLNGSLSVPVEAGTTGTMIELYYPPLFHLVSLLLFIALPRVDPYALMKILASAADALVLVPIFLIVRRVSGSNLGGILAAYALLATRNDYQMLSWGGYANIAGLLLITSLVYAVMTERLVLSAVLSVALALTHHLSTIFAIAVLGPYFAYFVWSKRRIPRSLIGVIVGGTVAFLVFYLFAFQSMFYYYSHFLPVYNQSLYMTPYILELVGPLLLTSAALAVVYIYARRGGNFLRENAILLFWAILPFLLTYAYLFGAQWHGVRWIAFIPEPLAVWTGIGLGGLVRKKYVIIIFTLLLSFQLFYTMQGYQLDILNNIVH